LLKRLAAIAFAVVFLTGICATAARADGDPASDVLYTQWTFVPTDAGVRAPQRSRLMALATEARKARFEIKIAIISSSYDLGSIAVLWRRPQAYARFLGAELSGLYRGRLVIVMPNGFGIFHGKQSIIREEGLLKQIPINRRDPASAAICRRPTPRRPGRPQACSTSSSRAGSPQSRLPPDLGCGCGRPPRRRGSLGDQPAVASTARKGLGKTWLTSRREG
jgi:hypothetical protein